ncbi:DUF397 domain-containing protein [Embleya sp. MST-111070]|uniref:DUF397 domain-containing protein n=1 Tax=Embleya sp. MST-111070 TaxID=3398231 RepID=UPI003F735F4A
MTMSSIGERVTDEKRLLMWRTSTYSQNDGACVEVAPVASDVATRDSKVMEGPAIAFGASQWTAFLSHLK